MRDTMQHFCEKHLDKIKAYMEKVAVRIPSPAKCTIEGLLNIFIIIIIINLNMLFYVLLRKKSQKVS